jgi:septum site-determining protein MinC
MSDLAFEMKGAVSTLTVLRLLTPSVPAIGEQLAQKVGQLPQFFRNAPIVIDLEALGEGAEELNFGQLAEALREHRLVPVAVRGLAEELEGHATAAGFGLLKGGLSRISSKSPPAEPEAIGTAAGSEQRAESAPESAPAPAAEPALPAAALSLESLHGGKVVKTPVRGGQIIYAQQRDLVLTAAVNAGGEVIADGNIHVYAPLRGRALAGAHGNDGALIFCSSLEAELVSVAGQYLRADEIPAELRGKPARIYLEAGQVVVRGM